MLTLYFKDSDTLFDKLPKEAKIHGHLKIKGFNHDDYQIGRHTKELLFDKILTFLNTL